MDKCNKEMIFLAASSINTILFGTNLFAAAVDLRTFHELAYDTDTEDSVSVYYTRWWNNTPAIMLPIGITGVFLNSIAYFASDNMYWMVGLGSHVACMLWTATGMKNTSKTIMDHKSLLLAEREHLGKTLKNLVKLNMVRVAFSGVGLFAGNVALLSVFKKVIVVV